MPTLPKLPHELLEAIASNLSQSDVRAFIRSHRCVYLSLTYYLYQHIKRYSGGSALRGGARNGVIETVQRSIQQNFNLEIRKEYCDNDNLMLLSSDVRQQDSRVVLIVYFQQPNLPQLNKQAGLFRYVVNRVYCILSMTGLAPPQQAYVAPNMESWNKHLYSIYIVNSGFKNL